MDLCPVQGGVNDSHPLINIKIGYKRRLHGLGWLVKDIANELA